MDETTTLAALAKGRQKKALTVRVVRKWTVTEERGHGQPIFTGMIVADAERNAMYAEIPKEVIPKKEYLLDIGKVYIIKKLNVNRAKPTFKTIDKELMIELTEYTTIEVARHYPTSIPEYVYSLTPFCSIVPAGRTIINYTDVLGYIIGYTDLDSFVPKNQERVTHLRKLILKDLSGNQIGVTLWGDHAINFNVDNVYDEQIGNIVVCLVVGCTPRQDYRDSDTVYLSGSSTFACYLNPQIEEAAPFYSKFKDVPIYIQRPTGPPQVAPTAVVARPLKMMTVADLNAILDPFEFEEGTYKCAVTGTEIATNVSWWYMSCKQHKKKADQQPDLSYRCAVCGSSVTLPRYSLSFTACDDTDQARFFAYDDQATQIVGKDCEAVMNPLAKSSGLPHILQNIVNKRYVFSVDLSTSAVRQYVVKGVLERSPRRPIQIDNTIPAAEIQTATSLLIESVTAGTTSQSPQTPQNALRIQPTTQTPAHSVHVPSLHEKSLDKRLPPRPASARKNILSQLDNADKLDLVGDSELSTMDQTADEDSDTSRPRGKRSRTNASKSSAKGGFRKTCPPDT